MKKIQLLVWMLFPILLFAQSPAPWYYELRIYHLADAADESRIDNYLEKAFVPALHRSGIKSVGVFKPVKEDTVNTNRLYVLIPFQSLSDWEKISGHLAKDKDYLAAGSDYINASHTDPPYLRIETMLMKSFKHMPAPAVPALKGNKSERVYELRSYEGATEKLYQSKVHMFNEGNEIKLFTKLNFNAIFYAEVLSGTRMPNLVYMTSFENKTDRDAHWKAFVDDPDWKAMSSLQQYKNTVSHIDIYFLYPTPYSDF
jgi:hypothetical protein